MEFLDNQRPLSLRWASKDAAEYLRQEAGLSPSAAAIAFDLTRTPYQQVSYPRAKDHKSYRCARRYKNPIWTPGRVIGGMNELAKAAWVDHFKQIQGERSAGIQSFAQAMPELVELTAEALTFEPLTYLPPRETLILRDKDKCLLDYSESSEKRAMRRNMNMFNEGILAEDIGGCEVAAMVRYFNQDFSRGGRLTAIGNSWQNVASELRAQVTIGGEETVELDYKTLHPAYLYAMAGAELPSDCYDLPRWPRDLAKLGLLVIINAKSIKAAIGAIAHSDGRKWTRDDHGNPIGFTHKRNLMQVLAEPGSLEAEAKAKELIADLKELHAPINRFFGKDMGAKLMRIDSAMAEAVMLDMFNKGIVVLPVHDSFLVQASKVDQLEAAMQKAAHTHGYQAIKIERKMAKSPDSPKQLFLL